MVRRSLKGFCIAKNKKLKRYNVKNYVIFQEVLNINSNQNFFFILYIILFTLQTDFVYYLIYKRRKNPLNGNALLYYGNRKVLAIPESSPTPYYSPLRRPLFCVASAVTLAEFSPTGLCLVPSLSHTVLQLSYIPHQALLIYSLWCINKYTLKLQSSLLTNTQFTIVLFHY